LRANQQQQKKKKVKQRGKRKEIVDKREPLLPKTSQPAVLLSPSSCSLEKAKEEIDAKLLMG
jgi:hypothetical protein